jgi:hypothetical protein
VKDEERVWNTYVVVYIYFKKWKSLYCSGVVALKSSMCSCIKKEHDFRGIVFFYGCVCGCVCVYDLYNCIIWNNRIFSWSCGCVVCMVDLYIFSI